jgi:hypothetical protein
MLWRRNNRAISRRAKDGPFHPQNGGWSGMIFG